MTHAPRCEIVNDAQGHFYGIKFLCPGCGGAPHILPVNWRPKEAIDSALLKGQGTNDRWDFNGNFLRPTFGRAYLLRMELGGEDGEREKHLCSGHVANGRVLYSKQCTHDLKGKTRDLPDLPMSPGSV